jgi:hypothetical protein
MVTETLLPLPTQNSEGDKRLGAVPFAREDSVVLIVPIVSQKMIDGYQVKTAELWRKTM